MTVKRFSHRFVVNRRVLMVVVALMALLIGSTFLSSGVVQADPDDFEEGDVFVGAGNGIVKQFDEDGTHLEDLDTTSGSTFQTGMCFDTAGNLYTTNFSTGDMSKFDSMGNLVAHPWGGPFTGNPTDCAADSSGNIYVSEGAGGGTDILKFDSDGTILAAYDPVTNGEAISGIALHNDQCTLLYTARAGYIHQFDVCDGNQLADFTSSMTEACYQLDVHPSGEVFVACNSAAHHLSTTGDVVQSYTPDASMYFALSLDESGDSFWVGARYSGNVYEVDVATGDILTEFDASILGPQLKGIEVYAPDVVTSVTLQSFDSLNGGTSNKLAWIVITGIMISGAVVYIKRKK